MEVKDFSPNLTLGQSQYTPLHDAMSGIRRFVHIIVFLPLCLDVMKHPTGFLKTWVTSSMVLPIKGTKGGFMWLLKYTLEPVVS